MSGGTFSENEWRQSVGGNFPKTSGGTFRKTKNVKKSEKKLKKVKSLVKSVVFRK
jgi:hypothetical protein